VHIHGNLNSFNSDGKFMEDTSTSINHDSSVRFVAVYELEGQVLIRSREFSHYPALASYRDSFIISIHCL
jgi:hypothetical protein